MTPKRALLTLALTGALATALAGCTSTSDDKPTPTPTATSTPGAAPADDTCVDGVAWMQFDEGGETEKTLPDGCDTIVVNGNGGTVTAGPAKVVVFMGNDNTVTLESVDQIDAEGNNNIVHHGGDNEPTLNTDGDGDTVSPR